MRYSQFLLALVGAVAAAGLWLVGGAAGTSLLLVAVVGWLVLSRRSDAERIAALEDRAAALERRLASGSAPLPTLAEPPAPAALGPPDLGEPVAEVGPVASGGPAGQSARVGRSELPPRRGPLDDLPEPVRRAWAFATGGNPIVRVAVVLLFVAVGLGVQQAVEWLGVGVQLGAAAAVGAALVALGWRFREGTPGFGFTLQGGGVGVLYLTVYAAYALYGVLPSLPAIALMAGVAALCGALALAQDAPGLAVLGVAGGFAAPVLAGTPEGNHVLLLGYYALLNLGVLGLAWARGWRSVSVVGFLSTFVTGGLWGGLAYRPELYASVQPFVVLSFAVYFALAVRFAVRSARRLGEERSQTPERAVVVDGALVFGLPAATFVIQAGIVEGVVPYGRAWSAAALAAVYLVGAVVLRRRVGVRLLSDAFLAIGLTFATLALPLAFERVVFGAMWVLEGAGLVWVGVRQRKRWMRLGGLALQSVAAVVLFAEGVLSPSDTFTAESLTGWIVALGLGLSAYVLRDVGEAETEPPAWSLRPDGSLDAPTEAGRAGTSRLGPAFERAAGRVLLGFALFWWTTTAAVHVLDLAAERHILAAMLGAAAASGALFLLVGRVLRWTGLRAAAFGVVPAVAVLWLIAVVDGVVPLASWRWAGWTAAAAVTAAALATERTHRLRPAAFVGAVWVGAGVLSWVLAWGTARALGDTWAWGAAGAVLVAALAVTVRVPAAAATERERWTAAVGLTLAGVVWAVASWTVYPVARPLPALPLLNPLALPALGLIFLIAALRATAPPASRRGLAVLLSGLGLGALTVEVLRGVLAVGAAPWSGSEMWASSTAQAAVAVAWTVLALVLALVAVRRGSRALWFFGAAVLAVVVLKLFLVDLAQAETLGRIAAFLIVGALMLLIGYRAPLPPAHPEDGPDRTEPSPGS